ncbi:MAG: ATP-binding protein [Rhodospirillales bacterium]|nr:ATP-binding protein [Rhodospirillales bacterium]
MTTPIPTAESSHYQADIGEWPNMLSLRTYSGKSVFFLVGRSGLLIALSVYAGLYGSTTLLALALAALVVDFAHTALQAVIQVRGMFLQQWVKRLVAGDLEFHVDTPGSDEISMYGRVLEALRQALIRSRDLETAQKELSEELRQNNETLKSTLDQLRTTQDQIVSQQKLAELGEVSAGVAHEIRNPLQFIKNFAESSVIIVEELAGISARKERLNSEELQAELAELTGDLTENMTRISNHSERANRIVSDMLDLRRDGQREFRPVDINQLLVEQTMLAYHAARAQYPDFNMDIEKELDADAGEISAVPEDLGRVFINMVSNACQAIEEKRKQDDGFAPALRLKTARTEDAVEISIRDNGTGMPPDVMAKMFTPFFTTKTANQGTGLGMSLSHDIVRGHGGTITPDSIVGEYTELTVTIPVSPVPEQNGVAGEVVEDPR